MTNKELNDFLINLERPRNIPEEAKFDIIEHTWEYGKDKGGYKIGEWKSWDKDGNLIKVDVWSEDKELLSREYIKQDNEADLTANEDDEQMNAEETIEKLKALLVTDKKETAEQAVKRYQEKLQCLISFDKDNYGYLANYPESFPKISAEELQNEEKRLNITLPTAYKKFVLKHGLIRYGETEREMIFPLKTLTEALKDEWGMSDERIDMAYEGVTHPDDLIIFSYGDEGLQSEYYHCFEVDGTVYDFNQDDLGYERQSHENFDAYLQWATNTVIEETIENLRDEFGIEPSEEEIYRLDEVIEFLKTEVYGKLDFTNKMVDVSVQRGYLDYLLDEYLVDLELIDPKDYERVRKSYEDIYHIKGYLPFLRTQGEGVFCICYENDSGFKRLSYFDPDFSNRYINRDVFEFYETLIDTQGKSLREILIEKYLKRGKK